jgi:BirA family transcriptional regulator, biotin operon repressor / biotin---[acetyl-CoA-carboxylase] ligase
MSLARPTTRIGQLGSCRILAGRYNWGLGLRREDTTAEQLGQELTVFTPAVKARMQNFRKIVEKTFVAELEHHAEIGSTNDRAMECAALDRAKLPLLILADRQTAGRGRGAHRWWTGPGSLAFSLLIGPGQLRSNRVVSDDFQGRALLSLAAGLAVVEAISPIVPGHEVRIHWPNDCMLDGRKLAGVLIEAPAEDKSVIGIGINVNNLSADAPAELRPRVATLRDITGNEHDSLGVLIVVLQQLSRQLGKLACSPKEVAARTNELCLQRGQTLRIVQGKRHIEGRCLGIAADGGLLLEVEGKPQAIYSGVVAPGSESAKLSEKLSQKPR